MSVPCHKKGCKSLGTKSCGACGEASYCSVDCQKDDWKVHKLSCVDVKKLPVTFQSVSQIQKYIGKAVTVAHTLMIKGNAKEAIVNMQKLIAFVEHQFGVPVVGTIYCERSNGDKMDNVQLARMQVHLSSMHRNVSDMDSELKCLITASRLLEHRVTTDDSDLCLMGEVEEKFAKSYTEAFMYSEAEIHCDRCLTIARSITGEKRLFHEYRALLEFAMLRGQQGRGEEAIEYSEKAYTLTSEKYDPVHPFVQATVTVLIGVLMQNENYSRADTYSRINYENLIDPRNGFDQESDTVAQGMMQLAELWILKETVQDEKEAYALADEAEKLIKKACIIIENIPRCESFRKGGYYGTYGEVLIRRGKFTNETRIVLERNLELARESAMFEPKLIFSLDYMVFFLNHMIETMVEGREKDLEIKLRDKYVIEIGVLRAAGP